MTQSEIIRQLQAGETTVSIMASPQTERRYSLEQVQGQLYLREDRIHTYDVDDVRVEHPRHWPV